MSNSTVDTIISQLDPSLQQLIGEPGPPPAGSSAPDPDAPFGFDMPAAPPSKREQTAATKEAEKATRERISPALKTMGHLARLLPGAEKVRLYRKNAYGQLAFICDLTARDIETSGDLETHINRHIVPVHKGGEYVPVAIDGRGNTREVAPIFIAEAPVASPGSSDTAALGLVREMIHKMENQMSHQPPPPDPLEQMMKAQQFMARMKEMTGQKDGGGSDMMTMFMMMQMMQPPRPSGPDPMLVTLLDKMDSRMAQLEKKLTETSSSSAMPPLPPPSDPLDTLAKLMPLLKPEPDPDRLTIKDVLGLIREKESPRDEDRPSWRDIISLMKEQRDADKPAQTVMDQIQAVAAAKQALDQIYPPQQGGASTTFWDALGALFSQEKFGAGIGAAIAGSVQKKQNALPAPAQVHQLPPRVNGSPALPPQGAQPPAQPGRPPIVMPEQVKDFCAALNDTAMRDDERIRQAVQMLWMLHGSQQWRPFVEEILQGVIGDEKTKVLQGMQGFFALLTKNELLSVPAAKATLGVFDAHWIEVRQGVVSELQKVGLLPKDVSFVTPPPAQPSEETEEPAQASEPDDAVGDEDEEPEGPAIVDLPDDMLAEMGE